MEASDEVEMVTELHVFDFDNTLYKSPAPPPGEPSGSWYYLTRSLEKVGLPGFDTRWNLSLIGEARRVANLPHTSVIVLTGRPDYKAMNERIHDILRPLMIYWTAIQLKPVAHARSTSEFKADFVTGWLKGQPSIKKVVMYEDQIPNLRAVDRVVADRGLTFTGVHVTL